MGIVRVRGHVRRDGTYITPHYRTSSDKSRTNNWGSKGNVNPFTGKRGSQDPFRQPLRLRRRRHGW